MTLIKIVIDLTTCSAGLMSRTKEFASTQTLVLLTLRVFGLVCFFLTKGYCSELQIFNGENMKIELHAARLIKYNLSDLLPQLCRIFAFLKANLPVTFRD